MISRGRRRSQREPTSVSEDSAFRRPAYERSGSCCGRVSVSIDREPKMRRSFPVWGHGTGAKRTSGRTRGLTFSGSKFWMKSVSTSVDVERWINATSFTPSPLGTITWSMLLAQLFGRGSQILIREGPGTFDLRALPQARGHQFHNIGTVCSPST